ncbi:unnamed protein product, partial [Symbiodinium microadriaticum]
MPAKPRMQPKAKTVVQKKLKFPPEPTFPPPEPPMPPSGPLLGGFQSAFTQALRDMGLAPNEESIEFAIQQLSNAVWEKLQPRIDEEIWQAKVQHARPGASSDLHCWNPNPVRSSVAEKEQEEVLVEDIEEEEAEEAEQDDWPDTWPDYDNDEEGEEGEEGHPEVIEKDAVREIMKDYEIPEDVQQSFFQLGN